MATSSEQYRPVLETERAAPGSFSVDAFKTALREKGLAGVLTENTEPDTVAALTELVEQANVHGLSAEDFDHALVEIKEQLDTEGSAVARHEFNTERSETKVSLLNVPKLIGLRWQSMLETFGHGKVADRAKTQKQVRLRDRDYIAKVAQAAIEKASLRKRYQEYIRLANNEDFSAILDDYRSGARDRTGLEHDSVFLDGIENILNGLKVPDPFETGKDATGAPIEVTLTPENEEMIKNHLRFILRDEVLQLSQLSSMKVMEAQAYHVDKSSAGTIAAKLLGSGTLWGMGVRTGGRLAVGGSIAAAGFAATPAGWGVIGAAVGIGAAAGFASQVMEYKFARRKQKKMDLAIGAQRETVTGKFNNSEGNEEQRQLEVVKSAEDINGQLQVGVVELQRLQTEAQVNSAKYDELSKKIRDTYRVIMDAEWRLMASRQGKDKNKQDYISFGMENRLRASLDLTENIKQANRAVSEAKRLYNERIGVGFVDADLEKELKDIVSDTQAEVTFLQDNLEQVLMKGEWKRRVFGAAVSGTFAGLSAVAMDYIHEWFADHHVAVSQEPAAAAQETLKVPQPGASLTIDHPAIVETQGKSFELVVDNDGNLALYAADANHAIDLTHPAAAPTNLLSPELHTHLESLGGDATDKAIHQVAQFNAEAQPDGTIVVKSVYDNSVVAQFHVAANGGVTIPEVPTPSGSTMTAEATRLVEKLSEQTGEWKHLRLELLQKATAEGRISSSDSADMVVARLERATRHVMLEHGKYPDADAALKEAFGRDAHFIQHSEVPWINGQKSFVSHDWEKLVTALRQTPDHTTVATPTPEADITPGASVEPTLAGVHPLDVEDVFTTTQPETVSAAFVADAASSVGDSSLMQGLETTLAVAGVVLEKNVGGIGTHLVSGNATVKKDFGTRLDAFTFSENLEQPKTAQELYTQLETELNATLTELNVRMEHFRTTVWAPQQGEWNAEVKAFCDWGDVMSKVERALFVQTRAVLDETLVGKTPSTLRELLEDVETKASAARTEMQTASAARARSHLDRIGNQYNYELPRFLGPCTEDEIRTELDGWRMNQVFMAGLAECADYIRLPQAMGDEIVPCRTNIADAIAQLETRLTELTSSTSDDDEDWLSLFSSPASPATGPLPPPLPPLPGSEPSLGGLPGVVGPTSGSEPKPVKDPVEVPPSESWAGRVEAIKKLTDTFRSDQFADELVDELEINIVSPDDRMKGIDLLIGNWNRLRQQQSYLKELAPDRILVAIGIDVTEPTLIHTMAERIHTAIQAHDIQPNIIILADIRERLLWQIDQKLTVIEKTFNLSKKFTKELMAYFKVNIPDAHTQNNILRWFNQEWNRLRDLPKSPLKTETASQLFKRLGCLDEHDAWDDGKANIVFQNIENRDKAWLEGVVKPAPPKDPFNPDPTF